MLKEEPVPYEYDVKGDGDYDIGFNLTKDQLEASKKCVSYLKDCDVLLEAVCGAGKSEIMVESMASYLGRGLKVALAIARVEVVKELAIRYQKIFNKLKVIAVYGGHSDELSGDLIICTVHQLYRYYHSFDLLVIDEVDAFPLKGDEVLMNIALSSCKGRILFSTATVNGFLEDVLRKRSYKHVKLLVRPSYNPLALPKVRYYPYLCSILYLWLLLRKAKRQMIIFVSRKKEAYYLYLLFKKFCKCTYVYSDLKQGPSNIERFRNKEYQFIFATTVLERGITIKGVEVVLLMKGRCFDKGSIVQMAGRVGRDVKDPGGDVYILSSRRNKSINEALDYIKEANKALEVSLL